MEPVAGEHPVCARVGAVGEAERHAGVILTLAYHPALPEPHADRDRTIVKGCVQGEAAYAQTRTAGEQVVDRAGPGPIADPGERMPRRMHAETVEQRHRPRHQPLAAGLVDGVVAWFDDGALKPCEARLDRRREPDGAAPTTRTSVTASPAVALSSCCGQPRDASSSERARFSVGIRYLSNSTALSAVNSTAVSQAVCTSGSAMPSIATMM